MADTFLKRRYINLRYDLPMHFWLLVTNWLPDNVIFLRLRGAVARYFMGSCGPGLEMARNINLYNPANLRFGSKVFIAYGCMFLATDTITVGDEVIFGPYCVISAGNHTRQAGSFRFGDSDLGPIKIGKGTWLGAHVVVVAGVTVGQGALLAAGTVVIRDIPQNNMVGGVPARAIKSFLDEQ